MPMVFGLDLSNRLLHSKLVQKEGEGGRERVADVPPPQNGTVLWKAYQIFAGEPGISLYRPGWYVGLQGVGGAAGDSHPWWALEGYF